MTNSKLEIPDQKLEIPDQTRDWLLRSEDHGEGYLALERLSLNSEDQLGVAREIVHTEGPISKVLDEIHPDGYWENDGPGYLPHLSISLTVR